QRERLLTPAAVGMVAAVPTFSQTPARPSCEASTIDRLRVKLHSVFFVESHESKLPPNAIDKTNLTGLFDFVLKWSPQPGRLTVAAAGGPEPLIIESVQKPTEN